MDETFFFKKKIRDAPGTKIKNSPGFLKFDNKRRLFFLEMNKKDHFKTNNEMIFFKTIKIY